MTPIDLTHTLDQQPQTPPAIVQQMEIPDFLRALPNQPRPEPSQALLSVLRLTDEQAMRVWVRAQAKLPDFPRFDDPRYATTTTQTNFSDEPIVHKPSAKALLLAALHSNSDQADLVLALVRDPQNDDITTTLVGKPITRPTKPTPAERLQKIREQRGQSTPAQLRFNPDHVVHVLVANPKRPNSAPYHRFNLYLPDQPVQLSLDAGVTAADVRWDVAHKFIELVQP